MDEKERRKDERGGRRNGGKREGRGINKARWKVRNKD